MLAAYLARTSSEVLQHPKEECLGRIDAGYTSIEAQKSAGSLRAHSQLFVQCLHQHTPLIEVLHAIRSQPEDVVAGYLNYNAHVSRQVYDDVAAAAEHLVEREAEWPEYNTPPMLISQPAYLCGEVTAHSSAATGTSKVDGVGCSWHQF